MAESPRRVLVVDDEESVRRALVRSLATNGFETREAADGQSAWELAASQRFDLIVTDIRIPGFDGLELAERIKQLNPAIAIILISAYLPIGIPPAYRFLLKPFPMEILLAAVRELLPIPPGD